MSEMTFTEALKGGLDAASKNWVLVLVQMATLFILIIAFIVTVAIPLGLAVFVFGSELVESFKHVDSIEAFTSMIVAKYLSVAIVLAVIVTFYILLSMTVFLFVYGANCGMLARSLSDEDFKFSMSGYFAEGRRLFKPLLWFTSIISIVAVFELVIVISLYFPLSLLVEKANSMGNTISTFTGIFVTLLSGSALFFLLSGTLSLTVYGTGVLAFKETGPLGAVRESFVFLVKHPSSFWFYILCIAMFLLGSISITILSLLPSAIPYLGTLLAIPFQLFANAMHMYIGLVALGSSFAYYRGLTGDGSIP